MSATKTLFAVGLLLALVCLASAEIQQNADEARELGEPGNNYCSALCAEAVKRNPALSSAQSFCKSECAKCVDEVAKTKPGAKAELPSPCKTAFKFKEIPAIIADFKSGKLSASKGP